MTVIYLDCGPEVETDPPLLCVKGQLHDHLSFWKEELQASSFVLGSIESGYVLPLKSEPTPFARKNQVSTLQDAEFSNVLKIYWGRVYQGGW